MEALHGGSLHGGSAWRLRMEALHGGSAWGLCMEAPHGGSADCRRHGFFMYIWCIMAQPGLIYAGYFRSQREHYVTTYRYIL